MANENGMNSNPADARLLIDIGNILEATRKPFVILEKNGTVLFANQRFYDCFNSSAEQFIGHDFFSAADKEWDIAALRNLIRIVLSGKETIEADYEIDHTFPSLGRKNLRVNCQHTYIAGIGRQIILLSIEDYTRRKLLEQALVASEERFRRLFETSHDGLLLVNKETCIIIEANPALVEILGVPRDEIIGKQIQEVGILSRETDLSSLMEKLCATGFYAFDNVLINLKTSQSFPAQVSFTNRSTVIQCNIRDISERISEKQLLQQTANEWQATFNAVPDLVSVLDRDLRILRTNDAFHQFFSVTPGVLEGRYCYEFFAGQDALCAKCPATNTLRDLKIHSDVISHPHLNRKFQVTTAPILQENKELISIIHVARDITDLEELERQLRQAQKMESMGTLAGGIAHDFNNLLSPILGYVEIALESTAPESPLNEDLKEVLLAASRAKDLVKQILAFSRKSECELKPLKIQFVLKEALKLLRSSIPANIEIKENIDPDCSAIMADPTHIHQMLMNLCTNSYQAMLETGGMISVSLAGVEIGPHDLINKFELIPGPHVLLEVSDSGPGIPREIIDKIFEPCFTTKGKDKGTGLGLAVVYGIVKTYNGAITVYSEPDKGTIFRIYLPAIAAEPVAVLESSGPLPRGNERILLVDDEKMIVSMMVKMLTGLGYSVSAFSSCKDALDAFIAKPDNYDLVITDMTMPQITGDKLAEKILCVRPGKPIILCTGFSHLVSKEKAKEIGIRKYLTKPVLKKELAIAVREVLDKK